MSRCLLAASLAIVGCGPEVGVPVSDGGTTSASTTGTSTSEAPPVATLAIDPTDSTAADETTAPGESTTGPFIGCGNGMLEPGEQCDGGDHGEATCINLFGYGGELVCTEACTFDLLGCFPPGMILIPAGEFEMGSDAYADDERPARQVNVDAFYIDATEVTVADYAECIQTGACNLPGSGGDCNWGVPGRDDHPLNCVSWTDASSYCAWAGTLFHKRLPTEAKWEKARAATTPVSTRGATSRSRAARTSR